MTHPPSPTVPYAGTPAPLALVIGSGFGGMAAAIRLAVRGWRVQVLEKLDAAGGRAYVWKQDGFSFDAGPTIITAPFLLDELWATAGRTFSDDVELKLMDPFYRIRFDDGSWFDYCGDAQRMARDVEAALREVICKAGGRTEDQASEYIERLQAEGRYGKDVY